ncbi:hypothetical protein [Micromonospora sp. NBC_01813]|uniref:hypothetical protein n=1 Tax=Micromonospora sp. NBC_01813 TaxID=2975988 RepID=UPI002DDC186D|nr:hypothetical protein [Micromonospora sp. NBC_01813]WSA07677.1 hypothetical protein OG958_26120 [Micromonospora sp. NBC_01813]
MTTDPLVCPGDLVALRQCDHLDGLRPIRLRVIEVWPAPPARSWVTLTGREINDGEPDRDGKAVTVRPYKDALARPGAVTRSSPGAGNPIVAPASGDPDRDRDRPLGPC